MNKIVLPLLFIGLIFLTVAFAPPKKGYKYTSVEGKMSVIFPANFEVKENKIKGGITTKISSDFGKVNFMTAYTIHENELPDHQALAATSLEAFNEQLSGEIIEKSEWVIKGSKGLKSTIQLAKQDIKVQYWVVLRGNIQYQVIAIWPVNSPNQKVVDKYFKSFKVK